MARTLAVLLILVGACVVEAPHEEPVDPTAVSEASLEPAAARVPPEISEVRTAGWWRSEGAEGTYRLILASKGTDKAVTTVHLQWIELSSADPSVSVRLSLTF